MTKNKGGYDLLAIAIIKQAILDIGPEWLKTENAEFFFELSGTSERDYGATINRWKKREEKRQKKAQMLLEEKLK